MKIALTKFNALFLPSAKFENMHVKNLPKLLHFDTLNSLLSHVDDVLLCKAATGHANDVLIGRSFVYKFRDLELGVVTSKTRKEAVVLSLLSKLDLKDLKFPGLIFEAIIQNERYVLVQERIRGNFPSRLDSEISKKLVSSLKSLHSFQFPPIVDEFEGGMKIMITDYFNSKPMVFAKKLDPYINKKDRLIVTKALEYIEKNILHLPEFRSFSLIHKDMSCNNIIVDEKDEICLIDWETAQTSPKEWELAILRQRFSKKWPQIRTMYCDNIDVNQNVIDICGVIQALRFWKSFPRDLNFVRQQRAAISKIVAGGGS